VGATTAASPHLGPHLENRKGMKEIQRRKECWKRDRGIEGSWKARSVLPAKLGLRQVEDENRFLVLRRLDEFNGFLPRAIRSR
jgi:hypothetical protein